MAGAMKAQCIYFTMARSKFKNCEKSGVQEIKTLSELHGSTVRVSYTQSGLLAVSACVVLKVKLETRILILLHLFLLAPLIPLLFLMLAYERSSSWLPTLSREADF